MEKIVADTRKELNTRIAVVRTARPSAEFSTENAPEAHNVAQEKVVDIGKKTAAISQFPRVRIPRDGGPPQHQQQEG
eukprot:1609460-Pyramimonas_sp.AAC.1